MLTRTEIRAALEFGCRLARRLAPAAGLAADEAEEVVGEAVHRAADSFDPGRGMRFETWAAWRVRDALRSAGRRHGAPESPWWRVPAGHPRRIDIDPDLGAGDAGLGEERLDAMRQAAAVVRQVRAMGRNGEIVLAYARGERVQDIARQWGISPGWVYLVRLRTIRLLLETDDMTQETDE